MFLASKLGDYRTLLLKLEIRIVLKQRSSAQSG